MAASTPAHPTLVSGAPHEGAANRGASLVRISTWRARKARSSIRFRRSQLVTSLLHLLALHERQAGTTLSIVYRPPRDIGRTQSR